MGTSFGMRAVISKYPVLKLGGYSIVAIPSLPVVTVPFSFFPSGRLRR